MLTLIKYDRVPTFHHLDSQMNTGTKNGKNIVNIKQYTDYLKRYATWPIYANTIK